MVIARLINLNVSCKLHLYSLQRIRSLPGPRLPKRTGNTHPSNYYYRKDKEIDVHFLFFIHCWRDLIRSKQLSRVSVCRAQVFAGFLVKVIQFTILPIVCCFYFLASEAPPLGECRRGRRYFWILPDMCGLRPCVRTHFKKGLEPYLSGGGTEKR